MRQPIETVPKDGRAVILEDDSTGTYELARWSAQASAWVGENAEPCNIAARYWHTMQRSEHRKNECQPKNPLQPSVTDVNGPELPDRMPGGSANVAAPPPASAETWGAAFF